MAARELPQITTFDLPPQGFDPSAATDSELSRYGFPRRPAHPRLRAAYERVLAGLRGNLTVVTPELEFHAEGIPGRPTMLEFDDNKNWCGAVVTAPKGDSFDWVLGEWIVPQVGVPTEGQTYYCASWVGIGGFKSESLCQAGLVSVRSSLGGDTGDFFDLVAWVEWVPAGSILLPSLIFNPGDAITVVVEPMGAASTAASVLFVNRTSSTVTTLSIGKPGGGQWRADSAEWIVERPDSGSIVAPSSTQLADFGTLVFDLADCVTHGGQAIGAGQGKTLNMLDDEGRLIAKATLPGPTTVQCDYVNPWVGWVQIRSGVFTPRTPIGAAVDGSDLDLYAVGQDGPVYTSLWRGGPSWGSWAKVGSTTFSQKTPIGAVARGSKRDLYAVHDDGRVYSAWWRSGPGWHEWAPIGHTPFPALTPVSVVARGGDVDLFAVHDDGRVYSAWWRGGPDWGGWAPIGNGRFTQLTPISAVARGSDLDLFGVGTDGGLYTAWWRDDGSGWHDWTTMFGPGAFNQTTPIAAMTGDTNLDLFGVGTDGAVYTAWWRHDSGWHGLDPIGIGVFNQFTPIAAVARGTNLDVFGVGTDSGVYTAWWRDGAASWDGWHDIGSVQFPQQTPVTAVTHDDTDVDLFAVDPNGRVLTAWLNVP
jgi:hypothetical protein